MGEECRMALFIATEKGYCCLNRMLETGYGKHIGFVVSFKEVNVAKSYDIEIRYVCEQNGIPFYSWSEIKERLTAECEEKHVNVAFAIGWKYLISPGINKILKYGLLIFHDSLLPKYRGFAPTPTAIICGERIMGVTVLYADAEADKGDILLQEQMCVSEDEYIGDIIKRQSEIYGDLMLELLEKIPKSQLEAKKQNEDEATYSIWRDMKDCEIDWKRSAREIYNLIRAVSAPYPGAFCFYCGRKIIIERSEVTDDLKFAVRQPGKVWAVKEGIPIVICGTGMLRITRARYEDGTGVDFGKLRVRL